MDAMVMTCEEKTNRGGRIFDKWVKVETVWVFSMVRKCLVFC